MLSLLWFLETVFWLGLSHLKQFVPNVSFLYILKTSQNRKVFWCFQGVEKECIGIKWVTRFRHNFQDCLNPICSRGLEVQSAIHVPVNIYLFKFNNKNTRKRCEMCLKLTIKTRERCQWRRSGVFIVNFWHVSHLFLVFLLVSLNN